MNDTLEIPVLKTEPLVGKFLNSEVQVLLVDNDSAFRRTLSDLLHAKNYLALTADSGAEAIEMIEAMKIELVVLDLGLPYDDGVELLDWLMLNHPLLPVVLISAHPNQFLPAAALGVGALLEKPLDYAQLLHTIRQLLQEPNALRMARINLRPGLFHYVPAKNGHEAAQNSFEEYINTRHPL